MGPGSNKAYNGHVTAYVVISCIVAASGGALFGYDNGVTGGVVAMHPFLGKFFPAVNAVITGSSSTPALLLCFENQAPELPWALLLTSRSGRQSKAL